MQNQGFDLFADRRRLGLFGEEHGFKVGGGLANAGMAGSLGQRRELAGKDAQLDHLACLPGLTNQLRLCLQIVEPAINVIARRSQRLLVLPCRWRHRPFIGASAAQLAHTRVAFLISLH